MSNHPNNSNKLPLILFTLTAASLILLMPGLPANFDSAASIIASTVFLLAFIYYVAPKTFNRKHMAPRHKQYKDSQMTDYMMQKIMQTYHVKEDSADIDEYSNNNENTNAELDESNKTEEKKTLFSPEQLPFTIANLWLLTVAILDSFFPKIRQTISKFISPPLFTILPLFLLLGLNGFLGNFLRQPNESLETTSKEKTVYIMNVIKMIIGWGASIYILITFL